MIHATETLSFEIDTECNFNPPPTSSRRNFSRLEFVLQRSCTKTGSLSSHSFQSRAKTDTVIKIKVIQNKEATGDHTKPGQHVHVQLEPKQSLNKFIIMTTA